MNRVNIVICMISILNLSGMIPGFAEDASPAQWQKQTLKGITSIRYGVADGSTYKAMDDVTASFSGLKVPAKSVPDLKADRAKPLSINEARVVVVAKDRENNQCWVGVTVDQQCQLKRTPSISLDAETYKVGKMCPRAQVSTTVKDTCAQFVKDLQAQAEKH